MEPLLTIAIPTYNGERTIKNLFDILLPQCTNYVEVLVSDNCSTDGTQEIVKEYQKKYPFLISVRNERNIGPDANFLKCMQLATGKFTWLVSDDDVVIEGAIEKVLKFIVKHPDVALLYATSVDFRGCYEGVEKCARHEPEASRNVCTDDKHIFMQYAGYYWGFMSSFICRTDRFKRIKTPERFYDTYWLQSYIHALCASGDKTKLGIISGPCIGAGIYVNTANFDSALINGVYYKKMLDFMVIYAGFDNKQLERLYMKRICHLSRHDILKEKSAGIHKLNKKTLFACTKKYPQAWLTVYPMLLLPEFICRTAMRLYRKRLNLSGSIRINRPE